MEHQKEHHNKKKVFSNSFYTKVYLVLGIALIFFTLYSMSQTYSFEKVYEQKLIEAKEDAKPAKIQLIVLENTKCPDCFDITPIIDVVKKANVNITKEEELDLSSEKAKGLIDKYGIEKIPAVLLFGEIDKLNIRDIEKKDDALLFANLVPPYTDAKTGKVRGKVSLIRLENNRCEDCYDLAPLISQLLKSGLILGEYETIDFNTAEGKELVSKYAIKKVPTIIMDKEAEVYSLIVESWDKTGTIETDGSYIMREVSLPYYDIEEKRTVGLVSMIVLTDKTCTECYDPNKFHKPVLQKMGVVLWEEKKVDISDAEGVSLIDKYDIEKVPTIILKGDMDEYIALTNAWEPVGTVETDGTYVFRKVEVSRQPYRDLTTGKIVS